MTRHRLPDPWRFGQGGSHPLLDLAADTQSERNLVNALRDRLDHGADAEVRAALNLAPDRKTYTRLWNALCAAAQGAGTSGDAVGTLIFALPVVIVTGSRRDTALSGV